MNSEMKCKNCSFSNQKEEIFYTINLAVKNISTIEQSFAKLIQEELISDFRCSNCG